MHMTVKMPTSFAVFVATHPTMDYGLEWQFLNQGLLSRLFLEVAEIALFTAGLGQFLQPLKTRVIVILNFILPQTITYNNCHM